MNTNRIHQLARACRVEYIRASGPGGQHRNKNETGIRLIHMATGIVAMGTESRSRSINLKRAFARMEEKLNRKFKVRKSRKKTGPTMSSRRKRLESKKKTSLLKKLRKPPGYES